MSKPIFSGIFTPSITISSDAGLDFNAWGRHLNNLIDAGVDGVLLFGSIGEFFKHTYEEKISAIDFAIDTIKGRTKLLIGASHTDPRQTVRIAKYAQNSGVDAVMILSPYYFGLSKQAICSFYGMVAEEIDLNVLLYNFPERTGNDLDAEIVTELAAKYKNICGIKDTVDTISHTRKIIKSVKAVRPDFSVFSGFDEYYLPNRISGGDGIVSGLTNVFPELFVKLNRAYESGKMAEAVVCARKVAELMSIYEIGDQFIGTIKAAVQERGLDFGVRKDSSVIPLTDAQREQLRNLTKN